VLRPDADLLPAAGGSTVLASTGGAPRVSLLGADSRAPGVEVSITHHSGIAVAAAVLEMPSPLDWLPPPPDLRLPLRPGEAHKAPSGPVTAIAGSLGLTGAAYLCSNAAARAGPEPSGCWSPRPSIRSWPQVARSWPTPVGRCSGRSALRLDRAERPPETAAPACWAWPGQARPTWRLIQACAGGPCPGGGRGRPERAGGPRTPPPPARQGSRPHSPSRRDVAVERPFTSEVQRDRRGLAAQARATGRRWWSSKEPHHRGRPQRRALEDPHEVPALPPVGRGRAGRRHRGAHGPGSRRLPGLP